MEYLDQIRDDFINRRISLNDLHRKRGAYYGYNECCVKNFTNLETLGFSQGLFTSVVLGQDDDSGRVLCPMCYEEYRRKHPTNPNYEPDFEGAKPSTLQLIAMYELLKNNLN